MAIYHLSVKPVSRSNGRSATAAAAYRAAERVRDDTTGQTFDYTRKRGIEHREIVLPQEAVKRDVQWARDRQQLWNAAEAAEKRKDARVAREYEVALPHELGRAQRLELVRAFATELANRYGNAVDVAIHRPHHDGDARNHHAHLLTTTRKVEATGLGAKTDVELADGERAKRGLPSAKAELTEIRARWAALTNEALRTHGARARVDHRSLAAQGVDRAPTTHVGPAVTALERRGVRTEVGYRLQAEAVERLERAAEQGRLERESREVRQQIVELSTDVAAALRGRSTDALLPKTPAAMSGAGPSPAQVTASARDQWVAAREAQKILQADDVALGEALRARREPRPASGAERERQAAIARWQSAAQGTAREQGRPPSADGHDDGAPERGKDPTIRGHDHGS